MVREKRLVVTLLAIHAALLAYLAWRMSPTMDEPAHLAAGVSHWRFGRFALYSVNPPLVRMVAALPVLAAGCEEDWSQYHSFAATRPEFPVGRDFADANGPRIFWLMTLARWACIPFSLLGGWICWRWANELFGPPCGLVAMVLWCFSPNILAHGALITSDVAGASLGVAATFAFWRWLKHPTWTCATAAGCLLGVALLVKATWIILWGLWPPLWLMWRFSGGRAHDKVTDRSTTLWGEASQLLWLLIGSLYILNAAYGFEGTGTPLGEHAFVSQSLRGDDDGPRPGTGNRFRGSLLADIPVPLPENFVLGIDAQKRDFEQDRVKYLRGELNRRGWWYFYLYALLVKVPLATWLLAVTALLTACGCSTCANTPDASSIRGVRLRDAVVLLSTPIVLFLLVSSQTGLNYIRYLLPAFPFVFIAISHVGAALRNAGWLRRLIVFGLAAMAIESLWTYPHSLSFFNVAAGGPAQGHRHLVDSNLDWGQDLLALKQWLDEHPEVQSLQLAYFGLVNPQAAGIMFKLPPLTDPVSLNKPPTFRPPPGWYAVSVTYVYGGFGHVYSVKGEPTLIAPGAFGYFRQFNPTAVVGTTIYIYHIKAK